MKRDVIVVGAGLAGLTTARYLQNASIDVEVIESSDRPGGRVKSDYVDGFVLDHGFQVINPKYPEVAATGLLELCDFVSLPAGFRCIDSEHDSRVTILRGLSVPGSLSEKIAFARFLNSRAKNSESFGYVAQSFQTLFSTTLAPFLRGVFLTEPSDIAADAAQKILRSFIAGRPGVPAKGVGVFSTLLAGEINSVTYNVSAKAIEAGKVHTDSGYWEADFIVVATNPTTAHSLVGGEAAPRALQSTTWYHTMPTAPEDSDLLAVQRYGKVINSVVMSALVPSYAPEGQTLIASTTLEQVSELDVLKELSTIWKCSTSNFSLIKQFDIHESLPFHGVNTPLYSKAHMGNGIFMAGDHRTYPSQQGAMESGRLVAEEIIRRVGSKRS